MVDVVVANGEADDCKGADDAAEDNFWVMSLSWVWIVCSCVSNPEIWDHEVDKQTGQDLPNHPPICDQRSWLNNLT